MEDALDRMWDDASLPTRADEVVVGGGLHAAIYCGVRVALGFKKPLVIEASPRIGGAFAMSKVPSFYLNSRNRPGDLGLPGQGRGLNVLPGAVLQPSMIGGDEFQSNAELAWPIRLTLAMRARAVPRVTVTSLTNGSGYDYPIVVRTTNGNISAKRVILATGLGTPKTVVGGDRVTTGNRILTFDQLMAKADQHFPLRGLRRVAVIGAGDSARTAVEMLLGQGPTGMTAAGLDFVEQVDWYGCPYGDPASWQTYERSRYKRLGCFLPRGDQRQSRIMPKPIANVVRSGFDTAYVDEDRYDAAVMCLGYDTRLPSTPWAAYGTYQPEGGRRTGTWWSGISAYVVGPASALALGETELSAVPALRNVPANQTALFRYADRTAALAASLSQAVGRGGY